MKQLCVLVRASVRLLLSTHPARTLSGGKSASERTFARCRCCHSPSLFGDGVVVVRCLCAARTASRKSERASERKKWRSLLCAPAARSLCEYVCAKFPHNKNSILLISPTCDSYYSSSCKTFPHLLKLAYFILTSQIIRATFSIKTSTAEHSY